MQMQKIAKITPARLPACLISAVCVLAACVAGCGRSGLHPVSGRVAFADGSPVPTGRVVVSYGDGKSSWGTIKPDGSFTIGTLKQTDGMRPGSYRVAIKDAFVEVEENGRTVSKPVVHQRFADPATSGLEFEVPQQTQWDIVVEKP